MGHGRSERSSSSSRRGLDAGRERARLDELRALLCSVDPGAPDVLPAALEHVRALAGAPATGLYTLGGTVHGLRLERGAWLGLPVRTPHANRLLEDALARAGPFAAYDALRPHARQRNRVLAFPAISAVLRDPATALRGSGLPRDDARAFAARAVVHAAMFRAKGTLELPFARVLLCDGPRLLGWIGVFAEHPIGARERRALRVVAPWLRARLRLEHQLAGAAVHEAALRGAFDALEAPAFVLDRHGRVVHASSVGRDLLDAPDAPDDGALGLLRAVAATGAAPGADVFALDGHGAPGTRLVILRAHAHRDRARLDTATRAWRLTPREAEVLARVAAGDTNRDIALTLKIAEATVEIHVTRLLAKARVDNRTGLVAAFWAGPRGPA